MIVSILRKDFPDVAAIIDDRIKEKMPEKVLNDLSLLHGIVSDFKKEIISGKHTDVDLRKSKNMYWCRFGVEDYRMCKVTEIREILIAVVLLLYNPERILGFESIAKYNLIKRLSSVTKTHKQIVSNSIGNCVIFYRSYNWFRNDVDYFYNLLKPKYLKDYGKDS